MKEKPKPKRRRAESREGMRVTTIALTDEMHYRLSLVALERRTVMTELVRDAIQDWLKRNPPKHRGGR